MSVIVRHATPTDLPQIINLYQTTAQLTGGIARTKNEITEQYVQHNLQRSFKNGICLVAQQPTNNNLIAEIHCYKPEPKLFDHVLSELTIVVHPTFQAQGIGKFIFTQLLSIIENSRPDILRVELIARESNHKAIQFYQKIGFNIEGRFEKRVHSPNSIYGNFEADIPMAWFNKNYLPQNT